MTTDTYTPERTRDLLEPDVLAEVTRPHLPVTKISHQSIMAFLQSKLGTEVRESISEFSSAQLRKSSSFEPGIELVAQDSTPFGEMIFYDAGTTDAPELPFYTQVIDIPSGEVNAAIIFLLLREKLDEFLASSQNPDIGDISYLVRKVRAFLS